MIGGSRLAAIMVAVALAGGGLVPRAVGSSAKGAFVHILDDVGMGRVVELRGLPEAALGALSERPRTTAEWQQAFALFVEDSMATDTRRPPVLAHYIVDAGVVRLVPRFPLTPGVAYRTVVSPAALSRLAKGPIPMAPVSERFSIPAVHLERTTRVVGVYPSAAEVPANLLRWYIEFSAPMEAGSELAHVQLLDASGREVPRAFLNVSEELWSPDRRRLTLLFDPGRVKRGIRTNMEAGAPLIEGRRYRLSIGSAWRDGRGAALASGFDHPFEVVADDRGSPDPGTWTIRAPLAGTRDPLQVDFAEPLDHALLGRLLDVIDGNGRPIAGRGQPGEGDVAWAFVPENTWMPGEIRIRIDARLEDLAGNNVARVFDADLRKHTATETPVTSVAVTIR